MARSDRRGDFATSYTTKPCLAFGHQDMGYMVYDEACQPLFRFGLPPNNQGSRRIVIGSANGFLLVWEGGNNILFVCNPITREYVELHPPPTLSSRDMIGLGKILGFGVSRLSGQYKFLCGNHVYTVGRGGLWRSIGASPPGIPRKPYGIAAFLSGNLHWLASDSEGNAFVCCFDLETELFTSISLPHRDYGGNNYQEYLLYVLKDRLCLCESYHSRDCVRVSIWWMDNYGDENSWIEEYAFKVSLNFFGHVYPLKVSSNGFLLFESKDGLFIYTKTTAVRVKCCLPQRSTYHFRDYYTNYYPNIAIYTPSFLSLTTM